MNPRKINIDRENITAEEINAGKDFQKVLKGYKKTGGFTLNKILLITATVTMVFVSAILFFRKENKQEDSKQTVNAESPQIKTTQKRKVNPPVEGIEIPFEKFTANNASKSSFKTKNGSLIHIPANAFIDNAGKEIIGTVEIRFREYKNVADIVLSGIPMEYDSAGQSLQLSSAGMFEITGYQGKNPVYIKQGKTIEVEMSSDKKEEIYNAYYFDTIDGNWKYLEKNRIKKSGAEKKSITRDSLETVTEVYVSENPYFGDEIKAIEKQEPIKPRKLNKNKNRFKIDVLQEEFPEMAIFNGLRFEVGPENKNFTTSMYNQEWEDVKLENNVPGKNYLATFTSATQKISLVVYPVYDQADSAKAMTLYQKKYVEYENKLNQRLRAEKAEQEKWEAERKKQEEEWKKAQDEYRIQEEMYNTKNQIMRVFAVDKFGIYNSDTPYNYKNGIELQPVYSINNEKITQMIVLHIDNNMRTVKMLYDKYPISFDPKSENYLLLILPEKMAIFKPEDFRKITAKKGEYNFQMNVIDQKFKNAEDFKEFLLSKK